MRAVGVNRCPADNRLAAAVPIARRKAAALGDAVLQTATDQRRAVKAAWSGRLTESTASGSGSRPPRRHRPWRANVAAPVCPARDRPPASPARTRCSTAASTPRNLTSGRRPRRLHQDSPCPKASGPEGRDQSLSRRLAARALRGTPAGIGGDRSAPPPLGGTRWAPAPGRLPSAPPPPAPPPAPRSAPARPTGGGRAPRSPPPRT